MKDVAYTIKQIVEHRLCLDNDSYLMRLLNAKSSKEYKQLLTGEENVILALNDFIKEKDQSLDEIDAFIKNSLESTQKNLEETLLILMTFFLKENQLGHSVYT